MLPEKVINSRVTTTWRLASILHTQIKRTAFLGLIIDRKLNSRWAARLLLGNSVRQSLLAMHENTEEQNTRD